MFDVKTPSLKDPMEKSQGKADHVKRITANDKLLGLTKQIDTQSLKKVKIKPIESMH